MSTTPPPSTGDCDYIFKIIVIGDSGVGKSSLTVRLSEDVFYKDYASTIAIDFRMYFMTFMDKKIRLQIWDTAGQERFQAVATAFYRGANGVMLCFDLTHRPSFTHLDMWMERVRQQALPGIPCCLIGCKSDEARGARQVTREEAVEWAKRHNMGYVETSAKEKENVVHAFQQVAYCILEDMKERNAASDRQAPKPGASNTVRPGQQQQSSKDKKEGCPC
eukprot:CAMPEP_0174850442 /NCGR_PEP_ID=MMETSP1114-20130205/19355_1 /TAXON_ID=312471 /ORGANISM="Neobodo designis, Strain CCAP 1951/1" /LENGTH=219 /DNA_ID=CAMNT_0016084903 /DNA_START=56 /DNA_END=715 /DNA_ORIENTATION=+